jgi:hypothetical protein
MIDPGKGLEPVPNPLLIRAAEIIGADADGKSGFERRARVPGKRHQK